MLLKGADLGALAADGGEVIPIIRHAISLGANITRLDFAIDYFRPAAPEELHQAWRDGDLKAPVRKVRLYQTDHRTKGRVSSGFTTYIGSPNSVRCLRVYDKAAKCGLPGPWTRLELRCAPPYGRRLAVAMLQYGIPDAGKQAIRDFVNCTVPWFVDATQGPSVDLPPTVEKKRDPKRWLLEDVLPVFVSTLDLEESIGSVELRNAYLAPLLAQSPRLRKAA